MNQNFTFSPACIFILVPHFVETILLLRKGSAVTALHACPWLSAVRIRSCARCPLTIRNVRTIAYYYFAEPVPQARIFQRTCGGKLKVLHFAQDWLFCARCPLTIRARTSRINCAKFYQREEISIHVVLCCNFYLIFY
jgi:hypothetical protein